MGREFFIFLVVSEKFDTGKKSLGTGIGQICYRKKSRNQYRKIWYRYRYRKYSVLEKSICISIVQHFGYRHTVLVAHGNVMSSRRSKHGWQACAALADLVYPGNYPSWQMLQFSARFPLPFQTWNWYWAGGAGRRSTLQATGWSTATVFFQIL